jgi:hypothetical protein
MNPDIITQVAFLTGRLLHQGTAQPVLGSIQIRAEEGPLSATVLADGTFALSGDIRFLFPDLASQSYPLHLTIQATSPQFRQGQASLAVATSIPSGSNFDPDPPTPPDALIDLGTLLLPADTISVRGRVVEALNPDTPIAGASVEVLHSGAPIPPAASDSDGWYRLDDILVSGPSQIRCSHAGFKTVTRLLLLDYGKLVNEEYFRLPPP